MLLFVKLLIILYKTLELTTKENSGIIEHCLQFPEMQLSVTVSILESMDRIILDFNHECF